MSISTPQTESRVGLSDVSWATFQALLADTDRRGNSTDETSWIRSFRQWVKNIR
ncbi:MAG: hypothetical protein ABSA77_00890 [Thermoguttaceae bacterium]